MARKEEVRLFNEDGDFACWVTADDASGRLSRGEADPFYEERPGGVKRLVGIRIVSPPTTNNRVSPTFISANEMRLNVGECRHTGNGYCCHGAIEAARIKVKFYKIITDQKSPLPA